VQCEVRRPRVGPNYLNEPRHQKVFAVCGPSASTEDIARRAEVAVGTIFRHFPTKAALIEAVFVDRLGGLTSEAEVLSTADDAGAAFFAFFAEAVRQCLDRLQDGVEVLGLWVGSVGPPGDDRSPRDRPLGIPPGRAGR
jgi:AcrR family transcriptional regulator